MAYKGLISNAMLPQFFHAAEAGDYYLMEGILNSYPQFVHEYREDGWTALHLAAHYGQEAIVRMLLAYGADPNARSKNDLANTPIHAAAAGGSKSLDALRTLLAHGADVNATQHGGYTALHAAAQNGDRAMVDLLLARGADPSIKSADGRDAASFARKKGHEEIAGLFSEAR